jgi:hypothetical protein
LALLHCKISICSFVQSNLLLSPRAVELRKNQANRGAIMVGTLEEIQKMSKSNFDTVTKSFGAWPKTAQAIATEMADYSKRSFENSAKAMEKLLGVKSLDKLIEVQSEYAKTIYEDYAAQVTKLGAIYAELAKESFEPYEGLAVKTSSTR